MKIAWIGTSLADVAQLHTYLIERNPEAAAGIINAIEKSANNLLSFPELGRPAQSSQVRILQVPNTYYALPYRIDGKVIEILAVFDQRQEPREDWL
jgi:plasmid stabilization system protein ParE